MTLAYPIGLALISVAVSLMEWLFPWRKEQRAWRGALLSDAVHLVFNGHFLGVIFYGIATLHLLPPLDSQLAQAGWLNAVYRNAAAPWPLWTQVLVSLFVIDFMQWCVHNLLHRIPWLWPLHKTHHSVKDGEMDWIVSFRFQWTEVAIYKVLQYFPLAFFGFAPEAVLFHALFGTLIGHLNHANLDLSWGPLKYLLNSPRMHLWHHDYEGDERSTVNFGIIFSCWDWLFGTAKLPDHPPAKLGFAGVETFPTDFFAQTAWPLGRGLPLASAASRWLPRAAGAGLLALGWWLHLPPGPQASASRGVGHAAGHAAGKSAGHLFASTEPAASSQPSGGPSGFAYARDEADATAALGAFGSAAREEGFLHPEAMVDVDELARALGSARLALLDVRPRARFALGHIPGAQPVWRGDYSLGAGDDIPGLSRDAGELLALLRARGVDADDTLVLYTDGGPEALRLWWTLRSVAGVEARILDGGLVRWKARGHPLAEGEGSAPPPGTLGLAPEREGDASAGGRALPKGLRWQELEAAGWTTGARFIDARSAGEYLGAEQHKEAVRAGHIPGALHHEWTLLFRSAEDPRFLPPERLWLEMGTLGIERGQRIVAYCQSGTRSAATFFALYQLGFPEDDLHNYDGSWAEYSRRDDLPIEAGRVGTPDPGQE